MCVLIYIVVALYQEKMSSIKREYVIYQENYGTCLYTMFCHNLALFDMAYCIWYTASCFLTQISYMNNVIPKQ